MRDGGFLASPGARPARLLFGGLHPGARQKLPGRQPEFSPSLGRGDRARALPVGEAPLRVRGLASVLSENVRERTKWDLFNFCPPLSASSFLPVEYYLCPAC